MIESLQKLKERALTYPEMAAGIIIHNAESLKAGNDFLLGVKGVIKEITDAFRPMKKTTNDAHRAVVAQEKKYLEAPLQAEKAVKLQVGVYVRNVEEIRLEAQRKADEAEAERLRKAAEIEANAQRFANHGHHREAEEIREQYVEPEVVKVPDAPSLNGISVRKIIKYKVLDIRKVPAKLLKKDWEKYYHEMIDSTAVTAYIKEHVTDKSKVLNLDIPGLKLYAEDSVSAISGK